MFLLVFHKLLLYRCCATYWKVAGSIPAGVSGFFIDIKSFRLHYGPGVNSASNRNEYQEYFLGVKAAGAYGWQPTTICAVVTKSGNLNFLESSGPLRACNGTALPVPFTCYIVAAFGPWRLEIFWKINLDLSVRIHKNKLDCRGLRLNIEKHNPLLRSGIWRRREVTQELLLRNRWLRWDDKECLIIVVC